ncbi:MAG: glycogen synthase [Sulfuricurvum sp. PC08-66]|nr:MAG: glycogen synthase [Sulfuricurvum sp. PC08-66]
MFNILFAAAEVEPYAKTGGLADVAGALPKALKALGHDVRVVMPRYWGVDRERYKLTLMEGALGVEMGIMGTQWAGVYEGRMGEVPVYFIEHEGYFGRKGLYDEGGFSYIDNDNRFIFFAKAVMQLAKKLRFHPHVVHANDWHTATLPILLNTTYAFDSDFAHAGAMLTIHNMQHQGKFYEGAMNVLDVGWSHFNADELEEFGGINWLKGGIVHADVITTVSPKYAREIQTSEYGWGLEGLLQRYSYKLHGILNGVDYTQWNPAVDKHIATPYDIDTLEAKAASKKALQEEFGLSVRADVPLIGMVGRLAHQKGIELLAQSLHGLLHMEVQIVVLGAGETWAEHFLSDVAARFGDKFRCYIGYRDDLAHRIEAGSDMFLMPSLFEPCGLNQIYSLRYGTLPIVRATGGLDDTVENYNPATGEGNGFKFWDASWQALTGTVAWAIDTYVNHPDHFTAMQKRAMAARFDWHKAALEYTALYERIVAHRHHT